jgi:hypothetical protein
MVEKLEHGKDFHGAVTWTEKAKAQQYYESLDIDHDPEVKDKWFKRARLLAERRERATLRLAVADNEQPGPNGEES